MTAAEVRRRNARDLAELAGGKADFARKLGMSTSQCSQIIGANPIRAIGTALARKIERAFAKEIGWLDVPRGELAARERSNNGELAEIAEAWTRLTDSQKAYYREAIFRDAAIGAVMPWFAIGEPRSVRYGEFERSVERDFQVKVQQLTLPLK